MNHVNENDWKIFRDMAPVIRERYLSKRNQELLDILGDDQQSHTERFWDVEERSNEIAKILRECLDGHSRSKMRLFMMVMLRHGMMTDDDLNKFSEELRERLQPFQ
jgi:hypothetical protein